MADTRPTYNDTYKGCQIQTSKEKQQGCHKHILEKIHSQMSAALSYHCKVYCVRFDLHLPNNHLPDYDQEVIGDFFKRLRRKQRKDHPNFAYVWVREIGDANKNTHFHAVIFLNGNRTHRDGSYLHKSGLCGHINDAWQEASSGEDRVYMCGHSRMVERNNPEEFDDAFRWFSYMAKERTKYWKHAENQGRWMGGSCLKPKPVKKQQAA